MENGDDMMDQKELAKKVKLIIMDVDGTLSDGRFFMMPNGQSIKSFDVKDGTGVIFARLAGKRPSLRASHPNRSRSGPKNCKSTIIMKVFITKPSLFSNC
jgi:hypothetical protein